MSVTNTTLTQLDSLCIGIAGEYLTCSDLLSKGMQAFLTTQNCQFDVALHFQQRILRIQVKTCRRSRVLPQYKAQVTLGYTYNIRRAKGTKGYKQDDFEILALVALDTKKIAYFLQHECRGIMQIILPNQINQSKVRRQKMKSFEHNTIERCLCQLSKPND